LGGKDMMENSNVCCEHPPSLKLRRTKWGLGQVVAERMVRLRSPQVVRLPLQGSHHDTVMQRENKGHGVLGSPDCTAIKGDPPSLKLWRTQEKLSQQFRRGAMSMGHRAKPPDARFGDARFQTLVVGCEELKGLSPAPRLRRVKQGAITHETISPCTP
jgi:hypothetical protein